MKTKPISYDKVVVRRKVLTK